LFLLLSESPESTPKKITISLNSLLKIHSKETKKSTGLNISKHLLKWQAHSLTNMKTLNPIPKHSILTITLIKSTQKDTLMEISIIRISLNKMMVSSNLFSWKTSSLITNLQFSNFASTAASLYLFANSLSQFYHPIGKKNTYSKKKKKKSFK
jgi:hypothetical protein